MSSLPSGGANEDPSVTKSSVISGGASDKPSITASSAPSVGACILLGPRAPQTPEDTQEVRGEGVCHPPMVGGSRPDVTQHTCDWTDVDLTCDWTDVDLTCAGI